MEKQTSIHFVQTVIMCTLVLPYSVPIAAIIEISHSLKKYFLVKKYTYILLNSLQSEREESYSVACSLGADAFTWCCTAQNKTGLF